MSTEHKAPHPALARRSEARLAAVKAIYSYEVDSPKPKASQLVLNILQYYDEDQPDEGVAQPDAQFLSELVNGVLDSLDDIDTTIRENLGDGWNLDRIGTVMRDILRVATFELLTHEKTPYKVIIDEYVKISTFYFDEKDIGFVNGILDRIASKSRDDTNG